MTSRTRPVNSFPNLSLCRRTYVLYGKDTERVHGFELVRMDIPGKLYWLYASSADEKAEWMTAISEAINQADAEHRASYMRNYEQYQKSALSQPPPPACSWGCVPHHACVV